MSKRPVDLPDFKRPPLSEVVLSLQFDPLDDLKTPLIGVLWERFRNRLPEIEEHLPLPQVVERFDLSVAPKVDVVVEEKPPVPRVWFLAPEKTELIQVQQDRFIHNWRKVSGQEPYPRYESIRERFAEEVADFISFLREEKIAPITINQCEVTYVNHITPSSVWQRHGELAAVLRHWTDLPAGGFLPQAEDVALRFRYIIPDDTGKPIGRLHVAFQPAWRTTDYSPIFTMNLTARGKPLSADIESAFAFFDLGRQWIVKGFADLTTQIMQDEIWGRVQ
jgi:hypothetical protein